MTNKTHRGSKDCKVSIYLNQFLVSLQLRSEILNRGNLLQQHHHQQHSGHVRKLSKAREGSFRSSSTNPAAKESKESKELKILARIHRRLLDLKMNSQMVLVQEDNVQEPGDQIETVQPDIPRDILK